MNGNMRNSRQRNEILNIVIDSCDHPNADTIYHRVKKIMPSISLGTVYRNLCLLVGQGLVRQISTSYGPDRYDKTLTEHSHFFCRDCKKLSDIENNFAGTDIYQKISADTGYKLDGMELIFRGVCKRCQDKHKGG